MSFLNESTGGQKSSIRLNMLLIAGTCVILLLAVAVYIIVLAVKGTEITQWQNMGIFCVGVATITTGAGAVKAWQKKAENGNK